MSDSDRNKPLAKNGDGYVNLHESQGNKQVLANDDKTQAAIAAAIQKKHGTDANGAQRRANDLVAGPTQSEDKKHK